MMLLLVCLLSVYSAYAQQCCTPDIWEGELHSATGYVTTGLYNPKFLVQHDDIIYDFTAKMGVYKHHSFYEDGTERSFKILLHYLGRRAYFIEANECRTFAVNRTMNKWCVPAAAQPLPPIFYGAAPHTIMANRYNMKIMDNGVETGDAVMTFSQSGCIPLEIYEFRESHSVRPNSTTKYDAVRGGTFAMIVPTITDREELVPPPTCPQVNRMPVELEHLSSFQFFLDQISS